MKNQPKIKVGFFSVISGFHEMYELDNDLSIFEVMDKLHEDGPSVEMRGKVCIRVYKLDECIYQWGSI